MIFHKTHPPNINIKIWMDMILHRDTDIYSSETLFEKG